MGLKVIGAGFGRTGTSSLEAALTQLKLGPTQHMKHVKGDLVQKLLDVHKGTPPDWDSLLSGYNSAVDWPWSAFYKELMEHSPEAKVVLTVRDSETWYESAKETVYPLSVSLDPGPLRDMVFGIIWDGVFAGRFEDKEYAVNIFKTHIEEVKRIVPEERLLVFEVADGWEPLCKFLGVPVPDSPFPRSNDRASYTETVAKSMESKEQ